MSRLLKHHTELTDGVGKCSVPMWCGGLPAGFCDNEAYGQQTEEGRRKFCGYVPGLACFWHGGPKKPQETHHENR